jgi:hypothetical protein
VGRLFRSKCCLLGRYCAIMTVCVVGTVRSWLFAWSVLCDHDCLRGRYFAIMTLCVVGTVRSWLFAWSVLCDHGCLRGRYCAIMTVCVVGTVRSLTQVASIARCTPCDLPSFDYGRAAARFFCICFIPKVRLCWQRSYELQSWDLPARTRCRTE